MLIDSHAHLNFKDFAADFDDVIARAKEAGVEKIINIGTSMEDTSEVIDLAQKFDWMHAAVGIHPIDDSKNTVETVDWTEFERLARMPKVVAIGECGLDYSRLPGYQTTRLPEIDRQKKLFAKQIEIAKKLGLPLSIHVREAQEDALAILDACAARTYQNDEKLKGVFHCFSGDQKYLEFILKSLPNFYISFAGNITFRNAQPIRNLAKGVPLDRLLSETDCPFLTPEPNRGKRNEPANIRYTAEILAGIKGLSLPEIGKITTENAERLFRL